MHYQFAHFSLPKFIAQYSLKSRAKSIAFIISRVDNNKEENMSKFSLLIALIVTVINLGDSKSIISQNVGLFSTPPFNNEPIIGILAEEMSYYLESKFPNEYHSYIAASYVKFVEGGGARAVPIWWVPKKCCCVWKGSSLTPQCETFQLTIEYLNLNESPPTGRRLKNRFSCLFLEFFVSVVVLMKCQFPKTKLLPPSAP